MNRIVFLGLLTGMFTGGSFASAEDLKRDQQIKTAAIQFATVINAGKAEQLKGVAEAPFLVPNDKDGLLDRQLKSFEQIHGWFGDARGRIGLGEHVLGIETLDQHIQIYKVLGGGQDHPDFERMAKALGDEGRVVTLGTSRGGVNGVILVRYGRGATSRVVGFFR